MSKSHQIYFSTLFVICLISSVSSRILSQEEDNAAMKEILEIVNNQGYCPTPTQIEVINKSPKAMLQYILTLCPFKDSQSSQAYINENYGTYKKILGQGGFGQVSLYMKDKKPLAVKIPLNMNKVKNLFQELYSSKCISESTKNTELAEYYGTIGGCFLNSEKKLMMEMDYLPESFHDKCMNQYSQGWNASSENVKKQMLIDMLLISKEIKLLHDQNIAHRDLKPENIMINWLKEPILVDFGGSSLKADKFDGFVGTPYYIDFDLVNVESFTTGKANDVFSLGIIFMVMTYGINIFKQLTVVLEKGGLSKALEQLGKYEPNYSFYTPPSGFEWILQMISPTQSRLNIDQVIQNVENMLTSFELVKKSDQDFIDNFSNEIIDQHIQNLIDSSPDVEQPTNVVVKDPQMKYLSKFNQMKNNIWNIWMKKNEQALLKVMLSNNQRKKKTKLQYLLRRNLL